MVKGQVLRVHLTGGAPWGFRLQGGAGTDQPVTISRIRRRSKAHLAKLQEGDEITLINGRTCKDITRDQAMTYIDNATESLDLEIVRGEPNNNKPGAVNGTPVPQGSSTSKTTTTTTTVIKSQDPGDERGTIEFDIKVPKFSPAPQTTVTTKPGVWTPPSLQQQQKPQPEVHKSAVTIKETVTTTHETPKSKAPVPQFVVSKTTSTAAKPGVWQPGGGSSTPKHQPVEVEFTISPGIGSLDSGLSQTPITPYSPITANDTQEEPPNDEIDAKKNPSILDDPSLILAGLAPGQKSDSAIETKKKAKDKIKMQRPYSFHGYSSEPDVDITVDDQKKICKQIADLLMFPINKQARGARMFAKRRKKAAKYTVEGFGQKPVDEYDTESMPDLYQPTTPGTPFNPMTPQAPPPPPLYDSDEDFDPSKPLFQFRIPNISPSAAPVTPKAPRTITIEPTNFNINLRDPTKCEHKAVTPDLCGLLAQDLKSRGGRAQQMFAKRQKRVQKYVLDDTGKGKAPEPARGEEETDSAAPKGGIKITLKSIAKLEDKPSDQRPQLAKHKTPWEAAMESPQGSVDKAFDHIETGPTKVQVNIPKHMIPKVQPPPPAPKPKPSSPGMPQAPVASPAITPHSAAPKFRPSYNASPHSNETVSPFKITPLADVKPFDQNYNRKPRGWAPVTAAGGDRSQGSPAPSDSSSLTDSLPSLGLPRQPRTSPSPFIDYNPKPRAWTPGSTENSTSSHEYHAVKPVLNAPNPIAPAMMESEDL
ncbi:synaptopodin 2-like protein isoform X2 [Ptychodera flava]|uniref:synaptopodin 2-like protein isoform X2 n=1 Tax=Ptychodera flava TaxID=63121 RepID=UPI00396A4B3E